MGNGIKASALAGLILSSLTAYGATSQIESFDSAAVAATNGWTLYNGGSGWGWSNSSYAGGSVGEARASSYTAGTQRWYADTDLGGSLTFSEDWRASGRMDFFENSASDGGMFFGFFNRDTSQATNTQTMAGFQLVNGILTLRFERRPNVEYLDSADFGLWVNSDHTFTLAYDADGGGAGIGRLTATVTSLADGTSITRWLDIPAGVVSGASLNSFGFYAVDYFEGRYTPIGWAVDNLTYGPANSDFMLEDAYVAGVYPLDFGGEGATWDGQHLWIADPAALQFKKFSVTGAGLSLAAAVPYQTTSYPVGLAWDGAFLWTDDGGTLIKIDPATGAVVRRIPGGGSMGGMTFDGTHLWKVVRPDIQKVDPADGIVVDVISNLNSLPPTTEDIAWDGHSLFVVAYTTGEDAKIFKIDPVKKVVVGNPFSLPAGTYNGLAFDGESLWVIGWDTRAAYKIARRPLTLTLKTGTVAGCKSAIGTVKLTKPAPTIGTIVALGDTLASATVPATLSFLSGTTSKSFTIKTVAVSESESGVVSATLDGKTLSQAFAVRPMGVSSLALSVISTATLAPGASFVTTVDNLHPGADSLTETDDSSVAATSTGGIEVAAIAGLECKAGPGPITVSLASSNPSIANPIAPSVVVPQGVQKSTPIAITTQPVLTKTSVKITATANGIAKTATLTLNPAATVSPTSLKFGSVSVGQTSATLNATLTNKGAVPFSINGITITGTYASWFAQSHNCPESLAPGASCTIGVTFKPLTATSRSAKLTIATSATSTPLSVSLSGTGLAQ